MASASASAPAASKLSLNSMSSKHAGFDPEKTAIKNIAVKEKESISTFSLEERGMLADLVVKFDQEAPDLTKFSDIYSLEEIAEDQTAVAKTHAGLLEISEQEKEVRLGSKVLEMVTRDFGNAWLPGNFSKASEYDDRFNHTDLVWELAGENGEIQRVAIDVTSSAADYKSKIEEAYLDLSTSNKFQTVKYFVSDMAELSGKIEAPRIIIGIDRDKLVRLGQLYLQFNRASGDLRSKLHEKMAAFDLGQDIVGEVVEQLDAMQGIIKKNITIAAEGSFFHNEEEKKLTRIKVDKLWEMNDQIDSIRKAILAGIKKGSPGEDG